MENQMVLPRRLHLEASTTCQLKCPACPTASGETGKKLGVGFLKFEDFKNVVDSNPWLSHIELSNWGEVFLNKDLGDILRYAYQKNVALSLANGVNLNNVQEGILEAVVKYKLRKLRCSIDGATPETYAMYRVRGDFNRVIGNIKTINEWKAKYRSNFPKLLWQFIVFGHNEHEIDRARAMAKELNMEFCPKLSWGDLYSTAAFSPIKNADSVRQKTGIGAASREEYREKYGNDYVERNCCRDMWHMPQVNYDGRILGCVINYWGDYGNVFKEGLAQGLNNDKLNYARGMLMGRNEPKADIPCSRCKVYERMRNSGHWIKPEEIKLGYYPGRKYIMLENRLGPVAVKRSAALIHRIRKFFDVSRLDRFLKKRARIQSGIRRLSIPLPLKPEGDWKMFPILEGRTRNLRHLSLHAARQAPGTILHPPHVHSAEEILMVLSGEVQQILPGKSELEQQDALKLKTGQLSYFPSGFYHSHQTVGQGPSNYLILKWQGRQLKKKYSQLNFLMLDAALNMEKALNNDGLSTQVLFDGATENLKRFRCHLSRVLPGSGYDPQVNTYDVLMIILEGELETLGQKAVANNIVFCPAGQRHGIRNITARPARCVVFEFHGV